MRWRRTFRNEQKAWVHWDKSLAWYRLRYDDSAATQKALTLLSRVQAAGRLALLFQPGPPLARLYVGVPNRYAPALERVARDFAFFVRPTTAQVTHGMKPLVRVDTLPWGRAFVAHLLDGCAFADEPGAGGTCLPQALAQGGHNLWRLPSVPPVGLRLQPSWNGHLGTICSDEEEEDGSWPLGRCAAGTMLYARGPVSLYGQQGAVVAWLVRLIVHELTQDPRGLIVIDGAGDLVPTLKRKSLVTRHLGRALTYVDIGSTALISGFNPLAQVSGETESEQLSRWQQWFAALEAHPRGVQLLASAHEAGVNDIPALQRWLQQPEQQHQPAAAQNLQAALSRFLSDPRLREWLSWPTNPFAGFPDMSLFFCCAADTWGRRRLLQAALLSALHVPGARIVLHGIPWKYLSPLALPAPERVVISNGPVLPASTVVLVQNHARGAAALAERFLQADILWQENLELLGQGEAIVIHGEQSTLARWQHPSARRQARAAGRTGGGENP